jgi:RNA polymerase sigma-70 factor, ECF subfamily
MLGFFGKVWLRCPAQCCKTAPAGNLLLETASNVRMATLTSSSNSASVPDQRDDDASLVARATRGDAAAIRAIMKKHNRRLYRMARSILRNDAAAEDALQSAYLNAFRSLADFRGQSTLGTWLTRIVMNEALALARSRKPSLQSDGGDGALIGGQVIPFPAQAASVDPERAMAQSQIQTAVEHAIDEMPDDFRTVLVAPVLEEMSVEETAELLGLKAETVKTRLHRARRLLRRAVEKQIGPVVLDAFPFAGRRCERMTVEMLRRLGLAG